ncbi:MAG: cysteine protease LapG [Pseudomonas sp.]|uniref:cysteine protease LapG n=1 Tax=Pseudomonas sp. TaxID=306 RepID=UPI003BB543B0
MPKVRAGLTVSAGGWQTALLAIIGCAAIIGISMAWADWDFEEIIRLAEQRYGRQGPIRARILGWQDLLANSRELPEMGKLQVVNEYFNSHLLFSDDIKIWGEQDYWATPVEALAKGAADCEDYALAKYFSLRQLGVPAEKMRITYVKALKLNQAHMVVTYYATPNAEPLVLDNLINGIRPAKQRTDLLPVYAFNAQGLYLFKGQDIQRAGDTKRLSRWQDVLGKMREEGFL